MQFYSLSTILFLILGVSAESAGALRGQTKEERELTTYMTPGEVNQWIKETSVNKNGISCAIRQANVPNAGGMLLTADGEDVTVQRGGQGGQRWTIFNRQNFEFGFSSGPSFNIINQDNHERPYLGSYFDGKVLMVDKDDDSGRQRWRLETEHIPSIRYSHQFGIRAAGGIGFRQRLASEILGDGPHHVQLGHNNDIQNYEGSVNNRATWELIDCYEVPNPN